MVEHCGGSVNQAMRSDDPSGISEGEPITEPGLDAPLLAQSTSSSRPSLRVRFRQHPAIRAITVPAVYMRDAASSGWGFWPGLSRSSGETIPLEMIILKPSSIVRSVTIMVSAGTSCRKARGRVRRRGDQNLGEFAALAVLHISGQETNRLQTRTGEIHHDDGLECGVMGLRQGLDHLLGGAADAPGQRNPQPDAFSDGDQPASDDMLAEPANEVQQRQQQ